VYVSPLRSALLIASLCLGACSEHVERMEVFVPPIDDEAPQLKNAVEVGQVDGGSSFFITAGVTDDEFKQVLAYELSSARLLAPSPAAARWRLDVGLDFRPAAHWAFADQQVNTNITYRLISLPGGEQVLERLIRTSDIKQAPDAGAQVVRFLFAGLNGISADADMRRKLAYEQTVRSSLVTFFDELGHWARATRPTVAATTPTQSPAPRPPTEPPPAVAARDVAAPTAAPPTVPTQAAAQPPTGAAPPLPAQQAAVMSSPQKDAKPAHDTIRFGDEVPFRCPAPGTEIDFGSGLRRVFSPVADTGPVDCPYKSAGNIARVTMFGQYKSEAETALRELWPLRVGNKVSFVSTGSLQIRFLETYRVVRHERVTVPAGTFDTFVIDWDCTSRNAYANDYHETGTFWYAPAIGYVVKVEHHLEGGLYARLVNDEAVHVSAQ
jgi:uncharacterized Zn-finger protein